MSKPNRILAEPKHFEGSICIGKVTYPLGFTASTNGLHELELAFDVLSAESGIAVFKAFMTAGKPGEHVKWHVIAGSSEDGWSFYTDSFESHKFNLQTGTLSGTVYSSFVFSPDHESPTRLGMERWMRGFNSWDGARVETPLGIAGVESHVSNQDRQLVSARVGITQEEFSDPIKWGIKAREYLNYVCAGLSFIDGGWVAYPIERFSTPLGSFWRFIAVSSSPREFSPEHSLSNSEMLKALFESYFREPVPKDNFWDAVSWMYLPTTNNEGRFLGAMTAIEFWLSLEFDAEGDFSHLSEEEFSPIFSVIFSVLKIAKVPQPMIDGAENRIRNLRQFSLKQKIVKAFERRGISLTDISKSYLQQMITRRNTLIHEGKWLDGMDWEMVYLARELVTRIVLHTISFEGTYDSYLGGSGAYRRTYPSCERMVPN